MSRAVTQDNDVKQYNALLTRLERLEAGRPEDPHYVGSAVTGLGAAFSAGWVNYDNGLVTPGGGTQRDVGFYKDRGRCYLTGLAKSGTVAGTIFTLPVGYRIGPQSDGIFAVVSNGVFGVVQVGASGTVILSAGSNAYVSFEGISFQLA